MKLLMLDVRLFAQFKDRGSIPPELLGPTAYVMVDHENARGTFPLRDMLDPDMVVALARWANRKERITREVVSEDVAVRRDRNNAGVPRLRSGV